MKPSVLIPAIVLCLSGTLFGAQQKQGPPLSIASKPLTGANGRRINYNRQELGASKTQTKIAASKEGSFVVPHSFVPSPGGVLRPFWEYAVFGSGIGVSNIVIGPSPAGGGAREIIIGGNSGSNFGADDFWQSIRRNPTTGNYDQLFVSPLYSSEIRRIALANIMGDSNLELAVMLADGRIYLYDFATKTELGYVNTGVGELQGLALFDLTGDGLADFIVTTADNLYVFSSAGSLLWQVNGAGGYDVAAGQMDNDPAYEIAATNGKVVDATTHMVQWTRNGGFGSKLKLAPLAGSSYQQLIVAEAWEFVYSYDVALQLPKWSIHTEQDIGALGVADVDNDGISEVIVGDGQWGSIHVYNISTRAQKWFANNPEHGVTDVAVGDVDNDGTVDLLWGAGWTSSGSDYLYVANTTGSHDIKWQSADLEGPFLGPFIGDLDGDGQPELVICSSYSESTYDSGRILVFDLATLALRGISDPVVDNVAWTGVHDLKLRDLEGDGRMEIVLGADYLYDGAVEIYNFNSNNTFTLKWTNTTRPEGNPFSFVDVADLDGNGTPEIITGNTVAHTGSDGVYVYIYDYPNGDNPWYSVALSSGFSGVTGLIVQDLDGNGSKEIAALVENSDLYTFDGPSRELHSLVQSTGGTLLSGRPSPSTLILGDGAGLGHFLKYSNNSYTEILTPQLGNETLDGVNVSPVGLVWTGVGGVLKLYLPPSYNSSVWQSPFVGDGFGHFVVTDIRNNESHVFASAQYAVMGFKYTLPAPTLLSAVSRKNHGAAGAFDIALPLTGTPGVECRSNGANGTHTLVLTFNEPLTSGHASVTSGIGAVQGEPSFSGNQMVLNLTGITNAQRVTITSTDLAATGGAALTSANFTFGVLEGDVNGSQGVNATDVSQTKTRSGQLLDTANFRSDVNCSGAMNATDVSSVKTHSGTGLP